MRRSRFTETPSVAMLQEAEAGKKARELCRQHGISEATYDHWQAQDGGMSASDLKRLKASEGAVTPYKRRSAELARRDRDVREALNGVVEEHPRWGFWMCSHRLRLLSQGWTHKRVDRIYKAMKLNLPRRPKRRLPARVPQPMEVAARANAEWSMDCMAETRYQGRRFRTLNILDEGVREAFAIGIDPSSPGTRVVRTLAHLVQWRGKPDAIRVDNGPEYLSQVFTAWCQAQGVTLRYIQPGKPNQNASIERFNRTFRHAGLEADVVASLRQVRAITRHGITAYNEDRPHHSLGSIPPAMFRRQVEHARHST